MITLLREMIGFYKVFKDAHLQLVGWNAVMAQRLRVSIALGGLSMGASSQPFVTPVPGDMYDALFWPMWELQARAAHNVYTGPHTHKINTSKVKKKRRIKVYTFD